jgi:tetratricopeptide (TPR) repeat protein
VSYSGFICMSGRYFRIAALIGCAAVHVDAQHSSSYPFPNNRRSLSAENLAEDEILDRFVTPHEAMRPVSGTISVARLKHHVSSKARREFVRADDEMRKKHLDASIEHLNKAIEIDPAYIEAHNNLGARYIQAGDYDRAIAHLRTASRLDPASIFAVTNLGMALWLAGHCGEAEQAARDAVRLAPSFLRAQYLLGVVLAAEGVPEALEHLEKSSKEIPSARLLAAGIRLKHGAKISAGRDAAGLLAAGAHSPILGGNERLRVGVIGAGGSPHECFPRQ